MATRASISLIGSSPGIRTVSNEAANRPLTNCCAVLARGENPSSTPLGPLRVHR